MTEGKPRLVPRGTTHFLRRADSSVRIHRPMIRMSSVAPGRTLAGWHHSDMIRRLLPLLVGALVLGGCTTSAHGAERSSSRPALSRPASGVEATFIQGHEARYFGPVTQRFNYANPGMTLTAPPGNIRADVPWKVAFGSCFSGPVQCVADGDAVVTMARVTGPGNAGTAPFGGKHMLEQTLMYVVTWDPRACQSLLSGRGANHTVSDCRVIDLITAQDVGRLKAGSHVYTFVIPQTSSAPVG